jgi:predicted phosphodiesterase
MKILALSDLHKVVTDKNGEEEQDRWIRTLLKPDIDAVVIAGDIFESGNMKLPSFNPYRHLAGLFYDLPVICVLGNHEFFYESMYDVVKFYNDMYDPLKYNVHYLDILGHYDIGDIRFVGNVLWYDGSMKTVRNQKIYDFANMTWKDYTIKNFNFEREYEKCVGQIESNIDPSKVNVLCTHCVPHHKLNLWLEDDRLTGNLFNVYSGSMELLEKLKGVSYAICGHTHRYTACEVNGVRCYNVGNDLHPPFRAMILDIMSVKQE